MMSRSQRETIVFARPFRLKGWPAPFPAGTYAVDTEEDLIEGLSFPAYRRVGTTITRAAGPGALIEAIPVDPRELDAMRLADAG